MKKNGFLLAAVILLGAVGLTMAEHGGHGVEGELSGTIDVTYRSAYLFYGIDESSIGGRHTAHGQGTIEPSVALDFYGTGLGLHVLSRRYNTAGFENKEELELTLHYHNSLFDHETYVTDYELGWRLYDFPDMPSEEADIQEMFASFSMPDMCSTGVVPSYTIVRLWNSESGTHHHHNEVSGWIHIFGLGYDLPIEDLLPDLPEQILHLSVAAVFNDGAAHHGVDHDWSHAVFGLTTDFDLGNELTFTPGIYYQSSWENTVNDSDILYTTLGVKYDF